jgi:gliding motility-associated-like protein
MIRWWHFTFLLITLFANGQGDQVWLHPNRGQWDDRIDYKVDLNRGEMLLEPKGFTYYFYEMPGHNEAERTPGEHGHYKTHVIRTTFLGAQTPKAHEEQHESPFYRNYFLSSDRSTWKSKVHSLKQVTSKQVYPGIDLFVEGGSSSLKYSWIVAPGTDASVIRWSYEGAEAISLSENGELQIRHSLGMITEGAPDAWLLKDGKKHKIALRYKIDGTTVTFDWDGPKSFQETLIIDPSLTFSTFTGSLADNWGFTAAPDPNGNLYAGGIVFGSGYPTMPGSFDFTFNGGTSSNMAFDVGITKFNATGTALLYSTYLGGSGNETPHSIVSSPSGELFILGVTGSANFPMSGSSFDPSFNGGPYLTDINELDFNGADMYIARFSSDGATLLASTYVGGSGSDGLNMGTLNYNYGDPFRGEIIVSATEVYVASSTNSTNFPTVNTTQTTLSGAQDAVVFKMDYGLSNMQWSRYFGGAGSDSGNGVEISSTGSVYIAGGTSSSSVGFSIGQDPSFNGGISDGFLARLNGANGATIAGTFIGTSDYDQTYFVQLDLDDQVYVYGQSEGSMPITPGCYGIANSGQFVAKYTTDLTALSWTTVIGAGTGHVEISPTAFLVSNCKDIYLSGWGGYINTQFSAQAHNGSSSGFPVTSDAYQSTTNGNNFWIAVLDENASSLKYATYMGGVASSYNHVDGGTSRFDKNGSIYHAVCGACGGDNFGFTTTPGVWAPQNQSTNCNLAAFKFELSSIEAIVSDPDPLICMPDPVVFQNNSANGNAFFWDFGDNTTSTEINPSHAYQDPGHYIVTLVVTDTNQCYTSDTIQFEVNIGDFQGGIVEPASSICPGESYQFEAYGGANYIWSPAQFLNNPNISNPIATVTQNTEFTCIISDSCGLDTVRVWLNVFGASVQISNDTSICLGNYVPLFVTGVSSAIWSPGTYLDNPNSLTPVSTPTNSITYTVTGTTNDGCELDEQVAINVVFDPPVPVIPDTVRYCEGLSVQVTVSGADQFAWSPPIGITPLNGPTVTISSATERYYYCDFTNACGTERDSVYADIVHATIGAGNDTIVCPGEEAFMYATGGVSYVWHPVVTPLNASASEVSAIAPAPTTYTVVGLDANGCYDSSTVFVDLFPQPFIQTVPDVYAYMGDVVQLSASSTTPGPYVWSPAEYLSCVVCLSPTANPDRNFVYTVTYTDANGCSASDDVQILYDPVIYVPNAFTPNGSMINEEFFAVGGNIKSLKLQIFDRWGELIYTGDAMDKAWDGTYEGKPCPDGVYIWKISYIDFVDEEHKLVGHVSLLR